MGRICRVAVAAVVVAGTTIAGQDTALAACHAFTVAVNPASIAEGGTVTVTVTRDAGVNPSSVDVSSVNETAQAGSDYPAVRRTVSFGTETQQAFTVAVTNDAAPEPAEAFRLHLSNPGGCPINTNFVLGADARVTIPANDTAPPTTPPPSPPPTAPPTTAAGASTSAPRPTTTTTAVPEATTTAEPSSTTSSTTTVPDTTDTSDTTPTDEQALGETEDDSGGLGSLGAVALIAAALGLGGIGYLLYRRWPGPAS